MLTLFYERESAREYAERWALDRNPLFLDFHGLGGNCTNFVSQCVYAGSCAMNYTPEMGWYYVSSYDRTPSWTGVQYFYDFMTKNEGIGPFARETGKNELAVGDVIQLGRRNGTYYHSLLVSGFRRGDILVCANTDNALNRPLSSYFYERARYIHIEGVCIADDGVDGRSRRSCFDDLINGISI